MSALRNQLGQALGLKGLQMRRRLLGATEELLRTAALRELSVARIAKLAGSSPATFYVYFPSVPDAVLEVVGQVTQSTPNLLGRFTETWAADEVSRRARDFVLAYLEHSRLHQALLRVRNLASDEGDRRFTTHRINAARPLVTVVASRLEARQAAGALPQDLNPRALAYVLLAMIERIGVLPSVHEARVTQAQLLETPAFLFETMLGARPQTCEPAAPELAAALAPLAGAPGEPDETALAPPARNKQGQLMGEKGERTRQRLLEAVSQLLATKSLMELTVSDVARAAEQGNSTFYAYFDDVPDAVLALIASRPQSSPEMLAALQRADRPLDDDGAMAFVTSYIANWQANAELFRVRNVTGDEGDLRFVEARRLSLRPVLCALAENIEEASRQGRLPPNLTPVATASAYFAMAEQLAASPTLDPQLASAQDGYRAAAYLLTLLLGASVRRDA